MSIRITSKKDGFRRCGIAHPSKPKEYPNDKFSKKQLAELRADPMLIVDEIEEKEEHDSLDSGLETAGIEAGKEEIPYKEKTKSKKDK